MSKFMFFCYIQFFFVCFGILVADDSNKYQFPSLYHKKIKKDSSYRSRIKHGGRKYVNNKQNKQWFCLFNVYVKCCSDSESYNPIHDLAIKRYGELSKGFVKYNEINHMVGKISTFYEVFGSLNIRNNKRNIKERNVPIGYVVIATIPGKKIKIDLLDILFYRGYGSGNRDFEDKMVYEMFRRSIPCIQKKMFLAMRDYGDGSHENVNLLSQDGSVYVVTNNIKDALCCYEKYGFHANGSSNYIKCNIPSKYLLGVKKYLYCRK
jgi:hypothetical protein